jgi:hypothetical protein
MARRKQSPQKQATVERPLENAEGRNRPAFFGRSGQLAVMAELLHRHINVAIPEVDVGDDIFVVKGSDETVTRVQVKAATAQEQRNGYEARFNVPLAQLSVRDSPPLVYIFPIRSGKRWSEFLIIRRATLFARRSEGAGTRVVDTNGKAQIQFRIVFRPTTALCGPGQAVDFQRYRDAWEPWPPPPLEEELLPGSTSPGRP